MDPTTTNVLLAVPTRGSDPGTWDVPMNANSSAVDGYFGGVQIISASSVPITLTAPAGVVTAGGGPTQSQNGVLRFTGALTSSVQVTLPLPGYYIIENLTTGNFVLSFRALGVGQVIAIDQGEIQHIYNDATNVRFCDLGRIGAIEVWAALGVAMPAWVTACTIPPYLLCDGSIHNFSTYPYLGARLGSIFGGNGITTFGVPDLRGRLPIAYDGTGTRITTAGCGLNGQTLGASLDQQNETLSGSQIPTILSTVTAATVSVFATIAGISGAAGPANFMVSFTGSGGGGTTGGNYPISAQSAASSNTGGQPHPNVQPSQVVGVWAIRAA